MSDKEWRPKVGERVLVQGTFANEEWGGGKLRVEFSDGRYLWFSPSELSPLPTPTPREPWDVLREAADVLDPVDYDMTRPKLLRIAEELEAAARPKPNPSLAEAVRAWLAEWDRTGMADNSPMREALARAEAEAGR